MKTLFPYAIAAGIVSAGVSLLAAPQAEPERRQEIVPAKPPNKTAVAKTAPRGGEIHPSGRVVSVADEQGRPVVGAVVRFQFEASTEHLTIPLDPVQTDARGEAAVEVPKPADRVWFAVTADGFGESTAQESAYGKSTIVLKRGRVIRVRAVDGAKHVLREAVPLLAGSRIWGREFVLQEDGVFRSPSVALNRKLLRAAAAQEQGPMLFSDLVDVATATPGIDGALELTLRPGVRLEGRLDDSVPRPITEGYVELTIVEGERGKLRAGKDWQWKDFTPVRPDGTFTFESLPGGGHAQLHVLVDGYLSRNPSLEDLLDYLRKHKIVDEQDIPKVEESVSRRAMWPRLVSLDRPRVAVTIPCGPTAACDFRLLDPSGGPVPGATVAFNPNGVFLSGGLFIPGLGFSQALLVEGLRTGNPSALLGEDDPGPHGREAKRRAEWARRWFLHARADGEGRVRVRNLPGGTRESFRVEAEGLVLPVSPLLDDDDLARRNASDDEDRYGMVELISGETIQKTVYLERVQPVVDRELIVVDRKGKPLPNVSLAVAELRAGAKDWQTWSTQRFGALPRGTTDRLGRLTLRVPSAVDGVAVERVRVGVNYSSRTGPGIAGHEERAEALFIHGRVVEVPLAPDDGVVILLPNQERRNDPRMTYPGVARYGRLEEILPDASLADWLATMIAEPNLAVLRKLLVGAKVGHPEPVTLLAKDRPRAGEGTSRVDVVTDGKDKYVVIQARVRPLSGVLDQESDPRELPECAYVLDSQGNLLAALGGEIGATQAGSPEDVELINLGPQEDWFVRVQRWEKKGPFELRSTYYRIGAPIVNSLQYFHYANSNAWSNGPEKVTRFGTLYFAFPGTSNETTFKELGTTADGAAIIPTLVWDGDRNRFVGAASQKLGGRPLYEVNVAWSQDLEVLSPGANQLVIEGGRGSYDEWHAWDMAVPAGHEALVRLSIPRRGGVKVVERALGPGRQLIQLQVKPVGNVAAAKLVLSVSDPRQPKGEEKLDFDVTQTLGAYPAAHSPVVHTLSPRETVRLLSRSLITATENITLDVQLRPR